MNKTPFYAESGGQVGDRGTLESATDKLIITDTKKENGIIIHFSNKLPSNFSNVFKASIDIDKRKLTENNHSATHLLHAALRMVLGSHVEQKGSLVNEDYLRFDFSHFSKVTDDEIVKIEEIVNKKIRENFASNIQEMAIEEARKTGAMALFGEKYGDLVRVVTFDKDYSIELCGGTHVLSTAQIGQFKIISESAVAAGVRRIEAITSIKAEAYFNEQAYLLQEIKSVLKNPKDVLKSIKQLLDANTDLQKQIESLLIEKSNNFKKDLIKNVQQVNGVNFISAKIDLDSAEAIKNLMFDTRSQIDNLFMVIGAEVSGKPSVSIIISDNLVAEKNLNAGKIIREIAKEINGGGGGQAFYANAGGTNLQGIENALVKAKSFLN